MTVVRGWLGGKVPTLPPDFPGFRIPYPVSPPIPYPVTPPGGSLPTIPPPWEINPPGDGTNPPPIGQFPPPSFIIPPPWEINPPPRDGTGMPPIWSIGNPPPPTFGAPPLNPFTLPSLGLPPPPSPSLGQITPNGISGGTSPTFSSRVSSGFGGSLGGGLERLNPRSNANTPNWFGGAGLSQYLPNSSQGGGGGVV